MGLKVCAISDTHASHGELRMPDADILVHAGDFSGVTNHRELIALNNWFGQLKSKYRGIFITPGNHDGQFEDYYAAETMLPNATVLFDKMVEFEGYKIYGSPWTITFFDWWFMKDRDVIGEVWKKIPDGVDILITHQPPFNILDSATEWKTKTIEHVGCPALRQEVLTRIKPKLHVFGHLHRDGGKWVEEGGTVFCNASVNNDHYVVTREPMVFEV